MDLMPLATAFADHLQFRTSATAHALADRLAEAGVTTRSEMLRLFAQHGPHVVSADWWAPGTRCHLSLGLPEDIRHGDLWFDPVEVSISLAERWSRDPTYPTSPDAPEFAGWVPIESVAPWQLHGVHQLSVEVPPTFEDITANQAELYCNLFSKSLTGVIDWLFLKDTYGIDVVTRMWGDPGAEYFGSGGTISGSIELVTLSEIRQWQAHTEWEARETSELVQEGLAFRGAVSISSGLWTDEWACPRIWND